MTGHAIVTGSSGGIGAAVCELLGEQGWNVTGFDIDPPPAEAQWHHVPVDLAVPGAAASAAAKPRDDLGRITAVVHCAAIQTLGPVGTVSAGAWQRTMQVNVIAVDELIASCRDDLIVGRGAVVAISSVHATATTTGMAAYAASKAALNGWVRAAALDLAPAVRVNAIELGAVRTGMLVEGLARRPEDGTPEVALALLSEKTPLKFIAEPAPVARLVAMLLDPDVSGYVAGCVLRVDGGALTQLSTE